MIFLQEIQLFSGSGKPRMLFFLLINVKMPTIVGILTFMCRKNFMLSELSMKFFFIISGPDKMSHYEPLHLDLCFLQILLFPFLAL